MKSAGGKAVRDELGYPDLAGLGDVLLEGAAVRRLIVEEGRVLVDLEVALLGGHEDYAPPPRGEVHCRAGLVLDWPKPTAVDFRPSEHPEPWILHDLAVVAADRFELTGTFGRVRITGRAPRVRSSNRV